MIRMQRLQKIYGKQKILVVTEMTEECRLRKADKRVFSELLAQEHCKESKLFDIHLFLLVETNQLWQNTNIIIVEL